MGLCKATLELGRPTYKHTQKLVIFKQTPYTIYDFSRWLRAKHSAYSWDTK
jgi:hypothetical protein